MFGRDEARDHLDKQRVFCDNRGTIVLDGGLAVPCTRNPL